jgi:hypothetical protein
MTTGERLAQISGLTGVTAAAMLLAVGVGATAGAALVNYSHLSTATAEEHLLVDRVAAQQGGGVSPFKLRKAAAPHAISARSTTSWGVVLPAAVARIVVAASPQFTSGRARARGADACAPYTGLCSPCASRRARCAESVRTPSAGGVAPFVSGRGFIGGEVYLPAAGAGSPECSASCSSYGVVELPKVVKNPTVEMMTFL